MLRKLIALLLCSFIAGSFVSCKKSDETQSTEKQTISEDESNDDNSSSKKLSLYFCYSDNLSPYEAESSGNKSLSTLLFDSLIKLDKDFNPHYLIANQVSVEGKKVIVSLNSYQFSDGTDITSDDVVYSIKVAKKSKSGIYVNQLSNISSYSASGKYTVVLNLKHYDKNVINILDFPIIKKNSSDLVNDDGKKIPPIGSGRYTFVDNSGNYSLKVNNNYYGKKAKSSIKLRNTPDYDSLEYLIKSQEISIYYSGFSTEEMPELKGKSNTVKLSNLVYLGINSKNTLLSDKNIRNAVSDGVDRSTLASKSYFSLGTAATSLFPDKCDIREKTSDIFEKAENTKKAIEHLASSGYNSINSSGYYQNSDKEYIKLNLLYNNENSMQSMAASNIIKQLKASGICAVAKGFKAAEYKAAVKSGNYDIYLAEIKLNKNFDYTALFDSSKNITNYEKEDKEIESSSVDSEEQTETTIETTKAKPIVNVLDEYNKYLKGSETIDSFLKIFSDEIPFIPLVFRSGSVSYSNNLSPELVSSVSDPFYNIEQIKVK